MRLERVSVVCPAVQPDFLDWYGSLLEFHTSQSFRVRPELSAFGGTPDSQAVAYLSYFWFSDIFSG